MCNFAKIANWQPLLIRLDQKLVLILEKLLDLLGL